MYVGWTMASIFRLRSLSWYLTAFADFWSLNGNTILMWASCSSGTCCLEHTFLSNSHFDKMSDGVLYEGFGIVQASKNHFKTFAFLMEELPIR